MDALEAEAPTLFDLLARCWQVGAPVTALAFSNDMMSIAFASADGRVSIAPIGDADPPARRYRVAADTGRATIAPRRKPPRALIASHVGDTALLLVPFSKTKFLAGGLGGKLVVVGSKGEVVPMVREATRVEALAILPGRGVIVAEDGGLFLYSGDGGTPARIVQTSGYVTSVAASTHDGSIAWGDEDGLHIVNADHQTILATDQILPAQDIIGLAWSPAGSRLAVALGSDGIAVLRLDQHRVQATTLLPDYPYPVQALSWGAESGVLATSGAFRIIAWALTGQDDETQPKPIALPTGRPSFVAVETVAMHPRRSLVAAGYDNGKIVVAPVGQPDELVVREAGGGAPVVMQWSADGAHLAFGTRDGEAAIVSFPPNLFK